MTKGQIIQRLLHALTHVLCFYDSEWSLFVFHLWTEVSLWGGEQHCRVQNYKRLSACGILCQDTMLDDKILLKCEGGGLGYEMPNGFPQLCSFHVVFIASLEQRPSVLILTAKHFFASWHQVLARGHSEWYFGWCLSGITHSECLFLCQRMVLIRTVAWYFEQPLKCCFSLFSFGVLQRRVCIHLILRKAASNVVWRTIAAKSFSPAQFSAPALGWMDTSAPPCVVLHSPVEPCQSVSSYWVWWVLRRGGHFSVGLVLEWTCSAWLLVGSAVWRWKALDSYLLSCAASLLASWCLR